MTLKSKDTICKELATIFNQFRIYTRQDQEHFWSDDAGEYQVFQLTFQEKDILQEKSAPYIQD